MDNAGKFGCRIIAFIIWVEPPVEPLGKTFRLEVGFVMGDDRAIPFESDDVDRHAAEICDDGSELKMAIRLYMEDPRLGGILYEIDAVHISKKPGTFSELQLEFRGSSCAGLTLLCHYLSKLIEIMFADALDEAWDIH